MKIFKLCILMYLGITGLLRAQEVEVVGDIRVQSIEILNGAGQDKVLVSDEMGSASWQDIGIKKRYVITPGMVNLFSGGAKIDSFPRSVAFPNVGAPGISLSIPVPSNDLSLPVKIRVLYTGTTTTGTTALVVQAHGISIGENTNPSSPFPPPLLLNAPSTANHLMEAVTPTLTSITSSTRFINLNVFRLSQDVNDTFTGELNVIGLIVEYN